MKSQEKTNGTSLIGPKREATELRIKINRRKILGYLFIAYFLILETTVFFSAIDVEVSFPVVRSLRLIGAVILFAFTLKHLACIERNIVLAVLIVLHLMAIQGLLYGFEVITFLTYPILTIVVPYLLFRLFGVTVFEYLIRIVYVTGIVGTILWFLQVFLPPFDSILQSLRVTNSLIAQGTADGSRVSLLFLYTIPGPDWGGNLEFFGSEIYRNNGMYHEPGAFAYFLVLALGLNTIFRATFFNKTNMGLVAILLTTFSTAGYIAIFFILLFGIFEARTFAIVRVAFAMLLVGIGGYVYLHAEFLSSKIERQVKTDLNLSLEEEFSGGRIERARRAVALAVSSPVVGRGIMYASIDFTEKSPFYFTGAGFWRTLSSYGLLFGPIIFYFYIRGIFRLCAWNRYYPLFSIFFFAAIIVGATSQTFFMDNMTVLFLIVGLLGIRGSVVPKGE